MVEQMFSALSARPDNGTMQFDLMLEALAAWSHFDEFWFETQGKLDLANAKAKIAALQVAKSGQVSQARQVAADRERNEKERQVRHRSFEEMRAEFSQLAMSSVTLQARGYALEKFLVKMCRFFDVKMNGAFRLKGTQIDGSIKYEGENYVVEAKWHNQSLSDEPVLAFCQKQHMNMHGRGIFISMNGYSEGVLDIMKSASIRNAVLIDGEDLSLVMGQHIGLPNMLDAKIEAAQTRGQFYIHPITKASKIK